MCVSVCHCVWFYPLWGLIDRFTLPRSCRSQGGHLDCMRLELHTSTHGECIKGSPVYLWIKRDVKGEGANNAREVIPRASCVCKRLDKLRASCHKITLIVIVLSI